jgi:hypothetical protein
MNQPSRNPQLLRVISTALCWLLLAAPTLAAQADYAQHISCLIDPTKLATLGKHEANKDKSKGHPCLWRNACCLFKSMFLHC